MCGKTIRINAILMSKRVHTLVGICLRAQTFVVLQAIVSVLLLTLSATAANVAPGIGYTNAFTTQPAASDWASYNGVGGGSDAYEMDAEVNATITAAGVTD